MKLLRTAGALLLAGLAATACTAGGEPAADPVPTPEPTASTSTQASPSATPDERPVVVGGIGSNGLTVRYQDRDGSVKTLHVEDFRR
jgi:ABC-type glycerol-3-phosphate transport system substrate-binding protein